MKPEPVVLPEKQTSLLPPARHPLHPLQLLAWPLRMLVFLYQRLISPALPPSCRYYPSCSQYAAEALAIHGALKGTLLAAHRLLRCHPWCEGGLDPVPQRAPSRRRQKLAQDPRQG
jgi:putative membrane protein insertion efficiency factor